MQEDELKRLASIQTPDPDSQAREAAVNAALTAFEAADPKKIPQAQGTATAPRLISIITKKWSEFMTRNRWMMGTAAAALLVVPAASYIFAGQEIAGTFDTVSDQMTEAPTAPSAPRPTFQQPVEEADRVAADTGSAASGAGNQNTGLSKPKERLLQRKHQSRDEVTYAELRFNYERTQGRAVVAPQGAPPQLDDQIIRQQLLHDRVESVQSNPFMITREDPVSTFSIDVDTASYALVRRALNEGRLPDPYTVRVEELINYFDYSYDFPRDSNVPFSANVTVTPTPWNADTKLMHVGIQGYDIDNAEKPQSNLVFLIDISGSMQAPDKLPLLKSAFRLLVDQLEPDDTISIVVYAGSAGAVLEPTKIREKSKIINAIDNLRAGGSTAGAAGINLAYQLAEENFVKGGVNRVMLATDGDFNVGASSDEALKRMIETKRKQGVFLSVFGFGQGNYNDQLMQTLAQNGNGVAAYIDNLSEAQKVLVEEAGSNLFPIAKDVKIQVEFNPDKIAEYRLIGYETRALRRQDFNNDRIDAGDIGSGHSVTAIYELTPVGSPAVQIDELRYETRTDKVASESSDEYAFVKIRYKLPDESKSKLITQAVDPTQEIQELAQASDNVRFSVAVAAFGQKLRDSQWLDNFSFDQIANLASKARGDDQFGYRSEFLKLVRLASSLSPRRRSDEIAE